MRTFSLLTLSALLIASGSLLAGCDSAAPDGAGLDSPSAARPGSGPAYTTAHLQRDLAAARQATARYQNYDRAVADGWERLPGGCAELPGVGGMGYHYGFGPHFVMPEDLDVSQPQVIMYEPQRNGRHRLVGAEYVVLGEMYGPDNDPPVLFGREFDWNPYLGLWALHVWLWRHNPEGMFEHWNPQVSCEHAPAPPSE